LAERPPRADEDVHMLTSIVDHVIERCTDPGGLVLDPFAGFGTTIERADALGRRAVGIELLPERVEYLRKRVPGARILEGDAREMERILREAATGDSAAKSEVAINLVLTSP